MAGGEARWKAGLAMQNHFRADDYLSVRSDGSPLPPFGHMSIHPKVSTFHLNTIVTGIQVEHQSTDEATGETSIQLGQIVWDFYSDARVFIEDIKSRCNGSSAHRLHSVDLLLSVGGKLVASTLLEVWTLDEPVTDYHQPHLFVLADGTEIRQWRSMLKEGLATGKKVKRVYPLPSMDDEAREFLDRIRLRTEP